MQPRAYVGSATSGSGLVPRQPHLTDDVVLQPGGKTDVEPVMREPIAGDVGALGRTGILIAVYPVCKSDMVVLPTYMASPSITNAYKIKVIPVFQLLAPGCSVRQPSS